MVKDMAQSRVTVPRCSLRVFVRGLALGLLLQGSMGEAYEVDNFTNRDRIPKDSRQILNDRVNRLLAESVDDANRGGESCSKKRLLAAVRKRLSPTDSAFFHNYKGVIETFAEKTESVEKREVAFRDSIYNGGWSNFKTPFLWGAGLQPILNIGGHQIGLDKLGHFMDEGYEYFTRSHLKASELGKWAHSDEASWGGWGTGVMSYADIAANYAGKQFWTDLTEEFASVHADQAFQPYFICREGRWEKNKESAFDWLRYVNDSWDEAVNCSEYMDSEVKRRVTQNLRRVEKQTALKEKRKEKSDLCPIERELCVRLNRELSGRLSGRALKASEEVGYYLHPNCYMKEFWPRVPAPIGGGSPPSHSSAKGTTQ